MNKNVSPLPNNFDLKVVGNLPGFERLNTVRDYKDDLLVNIAKLRKVKPDKNRKTV